jgi:hypothetical protein
VAFDNSGLWVEIRCRQIGDPENETDVGTLAVRQIGAEHCYIVADCPSKGIWREHLSLLGRVSMQSESSGSNNDVRYSRLGRYRVLGHDYKEEERYMCFGPEGSCELERCLVEKTKKLIRNGFDIQPTYSYFGPNSNSFVYYLMKQCGAQPGGPPHAITHISEKPNEIKSLRRGLACRLRPKKVFRDQQLSEAPAGLGKDVCNGMGPPPLTGWSEEDAEKIRQLAGD